MNPWLENALEQAVSKVEQQSDALSNIRAASLAQLQQTPWPTRKTEAWKYTSLKPLESATLRAAEAGESSAVDPIAGLNSLDILVVDGRLVTNVADLTVPQGMTISTANDNTASWVEEAFGRAKPKQHVFGLVNDIFADDVIVIDVAENAVVETPVRIVHQANSGFEGHSRVLVRLGKNAKATVIEEYAALQADTKSFTTGFAEYFIAEDAHLEHYRFELQTGEALSSGGCHFALSTKAELNSTFVGLGSDMSRTDLDILHQGEFADAKLNAIYLINGEEQFDLHSTIEHEVPNCTSLENVRGIAGGQGKATFNGRIHIHRDAQKTLAELNNRNLLLTDTAQINTKPELEIYADDVRCAHGATVAELDQDALYYLMSRGVSKDKALVMLNFGFINALVDEMPNEALSEWLRPILQKRFAEMGE